MMKAYLILLPILISAIIQGAIFPLNLVLLMVVAWVIIRPFQEGLIIAFWAGLFLDLAKGTPLGLSSLIFLFIAAVINLYSRRFDSIHPLFLAIFVFLASVLFNFVFGEPWLKEGLVLALLAYLAKPLVKNFSQGPGSDQIRLKI